MNHSDIISPFFTLRVCPQRFNLDSSGFTLVMTPEEIVDALLSLKTRQLKCILRELERQAPFIIFEELPAKNFKTRGRDK